MTDNLRRRVHDHRFGSLPGFTKTYGVKTLVWFENFETRAGAFARERQIKEWRRAWKPSLIEEQNPDWRDLHDDLNNLLAF